MLSFEVLILKLVGEINVLLVSPIREVGQVLGLSDATATFGRVQLHVFTAPQHAHDVREARAGQVIECSKLTIPVIFTLGPFLWNIKSLIFLVLLSLLFSAFFD